MNTLQNILLYTTECTKLTRNDSIAIYLNVGTLCRGKVCTLCRPIYENCL